MSRPFVPWHVLVLGNGGYEEDVGPLPGALLDARKFADEVPAKLGGHRPPADLVHSDGSMEDHYARIDAWLKADGGKKMLFCTGHGLRSHGIFYVQSTDNHAIPVQEYVMRAMDDLSFLQNILTFWGFNVTGFLRGISLSYVLLVFVSGPLIEDLELQTVMVL